MALKISLDGKKIQLTAPGRGLLTFIGGEKKKLPKGITFVNGEKKVLWDAKGLTIDIVDDININTTYGLVPVVANQDKLILSGNNNIYRYDISNLANTRLENTVEMGTVCGYSTPDTTPGDMVFYAARNWVSTSSASNYGQEIHIDPKTGAVSAANRVDISYSASAAVKCGGLINNSWLWMDYQTGSSNTANAVFYVNSAKNTITYSYGRVVGALPVYYPPFAKKDTASFVVGRNTTPRTGCGIDVNTLTSRTGQATGVEYTGIMVEDDGSVIAAGFDSNWYGCFQIFNKDMEKQAEIKSEHVNGLFYLIGRVHDFYYVVEAKHSASYTNPNLLHIITREGVIYQTVPLTLPDFGSTTSLAYNIGCMPVVSQTNYLCFTYKTTSGFRPVRILGY